jgi:hypothetical protein
MDAFTSAQERRFEPVAEARTLSEVSARLLSVASSTDAAVARREVEIQKRALDRIR